MTTPYETLSRDELSSHLQEKRTVKSLLNPPTSTKKQRTVTIESEDKAWHPRLSSLWSTFFPVPPVDDSFAPYLKQIRETIGQRPSKRLLDDLIQFWSNLQTEEDMKTRFMAVLEYLEHQLTLVESEPIEVEPSISSKEGYDQMTIEPVDEPYQPHIRVYDHVMEYHHWHPTMIPYRDAICEGLNMDELTEQTQPIVARYLYECRRMIQVLPAEDIAAFNEELPTVTDMEPFVRMELVHRWLMTRIYSIKTDRQGGPISIEEELRLWPADWATTRRRLINIPLLKTHLSYDDIALVLRAIRSALVGRRPDPRTVIDQALEGVNLDQPYPDVLSDLILVLRQSPQI